jgi:hypothetical protein
MTESASHEKVEQATRRHWEPPALVELPLFAEQSASGGQVAFMPEPPHPSAPAAAVGKLGFSIEMAFPLAVRSDS